MARSARNGEFNKWDRRTQAKEEKGLIMAKAKQQTKEQAATEAVYLDVVKRFPQLSGEKQAEIADYEALGWAFDFDEHKSWNAQHKDKAPGWKAHYGSLDGLISHIKRVLAGGPLDETPGEETSADLGKAPKKTKMAFVEDLEMIAGKSRLIDVTLIDVSPFEAQARRRAHFKETEILELGRSIVATGGFIHSPVVRPTGGRFQIVAGEQRLLAAVKAGYKSVDAKVKDLTDDQVRNWQLIENLQRKDVHPVDEGFDYQDLMKLRGWTVDEVALQVGKPVEYVVNRIKLTSLIDVVRKDVEAGILPLGHALEIAKFPDAETQKEIYEECVFEWYDIDSKARSERMLNPLKELIAEINGHITLRLKSAPFDMKAVNLRDDGLACVDCPDRTGARPGLFAEYASHKDDSCLMKVCFEGKKERFIQVTRAAIAQDQGVAVEEVPLVQIHSGSRLKETGVFGAYDAKIVTEKQAGKTGVLRGISVASSDYGQIVYIKPIADDGTKKASPTKNGSGGGVTTSEKSPAEKEQFYKRKEEIWNCHVGEAVRWLVFALAAVKFGQQFKVTGGGDNFVLSMSAKLWERYRGNHQAVVNSIAGHMDVKPDVIGLGQYTSQEDAERKIAKLPANVQTQLLYLLIHSEKGAVSNGYWTSQKGIRSIADEWKIDYRQIDAKVRVYLSSKKHQQAHDEYLKAVETNAKNAKVPVLYSEKGALKD